jgi:hypothetical protein
MFVSLADCHGAVRMKACKRSREELAFPLNNPSIINPPAGKWGRVDLICGQQAILHKKLWAYQEGISRKSGKTLVRTISETSGPKWKDLPICKTSTLHPIEKLVSFWPEITYPKGTGKARRMKKNTCETFTKRH